MERFYTKQKSNNIGVYFRDETLGYDRLLLVLSKEEAQNFVLLLQKAIKDFRFKLLEDNNY